MKYRCVTCEQEFPNGVPDGAVQLTSERHRVSSYRFTDGTVHNLRQLKVSAKQHQHLHRMAKKVGCEFCFPPPKPEPHPEPVVEQTQVQPPVPEPQIMVEEKPEVMAEIDPEPENELTAITSLAAAFRRVNRK